MALIMVSEMGFLQPESNDFYFFLNIIKNVESLVKQYHFQTPTSNNLNHQIVGIKVFNHFQQLPIHLQNPQDPALVVVVHAWITGMQSGQPLPFRWHQLPVDYTYYTHCLHNSYQGLLYDYYPNSLLVPRVPQNLQYTDTRTNCAAAAAPTYYSDGGGCCVKLTYESLQQQ